MNIKLYNSSLVYQKTINPKLIKNKIVFTSQINWWLWRLVLRLDLLINDTTFDFWDIIKIEKNWTVLYSGVIDEINKYTTNYQELEIVCNWYASLFSRLIYNESANYWVTKTDIASDIMSDIVDFYNTEYNYLTKDIETTIWTVSYETNYTDVLKMTKAINDLTEDFYWFVDENWVFNFKEKATTVRNKLTFEKNVFQLTADEDNTRIVNQLILEYKLATTVYNDSASQTLYWVRTKKVTDTSVADATSASDYATSYFTENALPQKKIRLTVTAWYEYEYAYFFNDMDLTFDDYTQNFDNLKDDKTIENIQVWEKIKILNLNHNLGNNLLIAKKTYNDEQISLDLENYDNFIQLIKE